METRPMTEMEERLMTRFMQADRERNEALYERDEAIADAKELGAAYDLAVREMDRMWTERDAARAGRDKLRRTLENILEATGYANAYDLAQEALAEESNE